MAYSKILYPLGAWCIYKSKIMMCFDIIIIIFTQLNRCSALSVTNDDMIVLKYSNCIIF